MTYAELKKVSDGWDEAFKRQDSDGCWAAYEATRKLQKHQMAHFDEVVEAL